MAVQHCLENVIDQTPVVANNDPNMDPLDGLFRSRIQILLGLEMIGE